MLNSEVRYILEEQFSQERNYKAIMNNVNKKQISSNKIINIILVPVCCILIIVGCICIINNNKDEYKKMIADVNIIKDNDSIINENDNNKQVEVAEKKIYKRIQRGEASWAFDVTIPENILNDNRQSNYVVKAKILSVGEGEMLPKQENFYNPFTCHTPIKMQIIENFMDDNKLSGTVTVYIAGGKMKIANILKGTKEEIEQMGIYDASQVDPEQYIEYMWVGGEYYEPSVNDEYVMIITKVNQNLYTIGAGGYSIFKIEKSNGQERYINVLTNKEWKIK